MHRNAASGEELHQETRALMKRLEEEKQTPHKLRIQQDGQSTCQEEDFTTETK